MTTQRDEFIEKMKQQLDAINAQISEFEAAAEEGGEKVRADFDEQVDKLRENGKLMEETRKIRDAFIHSVNYFRSQLK